MIKNEIIHTIIRYISPLWRVLTQELICIANDIFAEKTNNLHLVLDQKWWNNTFKILFIKVDPDYFQIKDIVWKILINLEGLIFQL